MTTPLTGTTLVDCAKANAKQGIEVAAKQCGYGQDLDRFSQALTQACDEMGIQIEGLSDLLTRSNTPLPREGEVIAPDTPSDL
ncbi:MAG: hypothetical protein SWY16_08075 [Cyanobacteriota bacterium]|nr:hypothetical protein [Cyanobacteriota bacterium]